MSKVMAFAGFVVTLAVGSLALAFLVRNFAPVGLQRLFSFQGA